MQDKRKLFKSVAFGVASALLTDIILMCVAAAVFLSVGLPQDVGILDYSMIALAAAGAFVGGFIASKINKGAALIVGAITGACAFLVITVIAMLRNTDSFSAMTLIRLAAMVFASALGGIAGTRQRNKLKF